MIDSTLETLRTEAVNLASLAVVFGAISYVLKRDAIFVGMRRARREIVTNLALLLVNAVVVVPLLAVPLLIGHSLIPRPEALVALWTSLPGVASVLIAVLLIDLAAYWRHRIEHARALWPIHATHHADEAMNWLSVRRKHPLGEALSMALDSLPVILIGLPWWAIAVAVILRGWWGYFIHADVPWTLGPFGKLLISPAAHRLHHIRDEALMGHNFGNTVTLWDRLFGTYMDPTPYLNCDTGIAEGTRGAVGELVRPFEARYWKTRPEAAAEPAE